MLYTFSYDSIGIDVTVVVFTLCVEGLQTE